MKLLWAAATLAQLALAAAVWRVGLHDWWLAVLLSEVVRTVIMWPYWGTDVYYTSWFWTEPISACIRLACAFQIAKRSHDHGGWAAAGLAVAVMLGSLAMATSPESWPMARRYRLVLMQFYALAPAGIIAGAYVGGATPNMGVIAYFGVDVARCVAEQFTRDRGQIETINMIYLGASAVLFSAAVFIEERHRRWI